MRKVVLLALIGLALGIVLGLLIGWRLWPVRYTNTAPHQLRWDYRNDYVLMIAAAYQVEGNVGAAQDRLALVNAESPAQPVVELAEQLIATDGGQGDIVMLVRLADALGAVTPVMTPYLEGQQ